MPDRDGYPTQEELQHILDFSGTPSEFIDYIDSIWWHEGFRVKGGRDDFRMVKRCYLSTWGWSGNEDIIGVLRQTWFWMLYWRQSNRGGHYIFEVPKTKFNELFQFEYGLPHSSIDSELPQLLLDISADLFMAKAHPKWGKNRQYGFNEGISYARSKLNRRIKDIEAKPDEQKP